MRTLEFINQHEIMVINTILIALVSIFTLIANIIFVVKLYLEKETLTKELLFFSKLNLKKKIIFTIFFFCIAVPNKIWVKDMHGFMINIFLNLSNFILATFFPPLILIFLVRMILAAESIVFGYSFEKEGAPRNLIISVIFSNNFQFATEFVEKFYGNPYGFGIKQAKYAFISTGVGMTYRYIKVREIGFIDTERQRLTTESIEHFKTTGTPLTPEILTELNRLAEEKAVEKTILVATEQKLIGGFLAVGKWFYGGS